MADLTTPSWGNCSVLDGWRDHPVPIGFRLQERRLYPSAPLWRFEAQPYVQLADRENSTESEVLRAPCQSLAGCLSAWRARTRAWSDRQHRGSRSNPTGEHIPSALIVCHALWRLARDLRMAGAGASAKTAKLGCPQYSECRRLRTASAHTVWGRVFAAFAASQCTDSAGTRICGMPAQTRMPSGIALVLSRGSSGMRRTARPHSCAGFNNGAAAKPADGCGKMLR